VTTENRPARIPALQLDGTVHLEELDSRLLRGNPLSDPSIRPVWVYTPPGYDRDLHRRYPTVYVLPGYNGHLSMWLTHGPFRASVPEMIDRLFRERDVPEAIVVYLEASTRYGGSQYLDSPGTGRYHSYLCEEVVPWVDRRYRTLPDRDHRAVTGKSSGGYGAMITAMRRPDLFGALATHAGDALFDTTYRSAIPARIRLLRDYYDGSYDQYFDQLKGREFGTRAGDEDLMEIYAYASAYSADPDGTVHLPFDQPGSYADAVWTRWRENDPVVMAAQAPFASALSSLRAVWIDAGDSDEYFLDLGAAAFRRAVEAAGLPPSRLYFELFPAGHAAIEYRYPLAVAWLCQRLEASQA
jgi:S-formylglutathione hydrolase FrmB